MAKRFTDTDIWEEDWYYELSLEYKMFWFYLKDTCDHAGIWRPKTRAFMSAIDVEISLDKALEYFNNGKQRIRILPNGKWFIEDFFAFQYSSKTSVCRLNLKNRVHKSVFGLYQENDISISTIRGLKEVVDDGSGFTYTPEDFEVKLGSS